VHIRETESITVVEPVFDPGLTADAVASVTRDAIVAGGGGELRLWTSAEPAAESAMAAGFVEDRGVICFERPLPLREERDLPPGVRRASFRLGVDEGAFLVVHRDAFGPHPDLGGWNRRSLAWRTALPWFDAGGLTIAWDRGRPIAVCWAKAFPPGIGEIYLIAVRPDTASRGIGRALLVSGLHYMTRRGARTGRIFTDAANERAARLYQRLGFEAIGERRRLVRS
jgi:mycothiol synthase